MNFPYNKIHIKFNISILANILIIWNYNFCFEFRKNAFVVIKM